jgi:hypothetical protein
MDDDNRRTFIDPGDTAEPVVDFYDLPGPQSEGMFQFPRELELFKGRCSA